MTAIAIMVGWQVFTIFSYIYAAHKGYTKFTPASVTFSVLIYGILMTVLMAAGFAGTWQGFILLVWWGLNAATAIGYIDRKVDVTPRTAAWSSVVSMLLIALMLSLA